MIINSKVVQENATQLQNIVFVSDEISIPIKYPTKILECHEGRYHCSLKKWKDLPRTVEFDWKGLQTGVSFAPLT